MAWDINSTLLQGTALVGSGASTTVTGSWTKLWDIPAAGGNFGSTWTPRSGTMLLNTGPYGFARTGVVEFVFWLRGVTLTGGPTNSQLTLDIDQADDASGTNAEAVGRFKLNGPEYTDVGGSTLYRRQDTANESKKVQYSMVALVRRPYIRYVATIAISGGASPTVTYANCDLRARAIYADIEIRPPQE